MDCSVAVETVIGLVPAMSVTGSVAVMVAAPVFLPVATPRFLAALLTPAMFGADDDHDTNCVRLRVVPS